MTDMRTSRHRTRGLGAARSGTAHFWMQRVTAIANIPLTLLFLAFLIALIGSDYGVARAYLANPFIAIILILLVISGAFHMCIGMQGIIEDYIHSHPAKMMFLAGNTLFSAAIGVTCIYAILRISLGS